MVKDVFEVSDQDNWFEFSGAKCEVVDTRDTRRALNDGHLIPGDAYTAHRGSFAHKKLQLVEIDTALSDARSEAIKAWQAQFHTTADPPFVAYEKENGPLHETKPAPAPAESPASPKPSAEAPPHAPVWISEKTDTAAAPPSVSKPSAQVAPAKGA
jgi:hypothetical protein